MAASGQDQADLLADVTLVPGMTLGWYQGRLGIDRGNAVDAAVRLVHSDDLTTASDGSPVVVGLVTLVTKLYMRDKESFSDPASDVRVRGWQGPDLPLAES